MKFNEKIIFLRKQKGMTQEALAFKLGVSRQSVSKWETGECEPDIKKLKELANMFDVSLDYLLNDNYEDEVDEKEQSEENYNVYNNYHIEKNSWLIITIVSVILLIVAFVMSFFIEIDIHSGHSGFIGFLETWTIEAIIVKLIMLISMIFMIIGIIKIIMKSRSKNNV